MGVRLDDEILPRYRCDVLCKSRFDMLPFVERAGHDVNTHKRLQSITRILSHEDQLKVRENS